MEEHVIKKGCTPEELEVKQMARDGLCRDCKGTAYGWWDCPDEGTCTGFKDECDAIVRDEEGTVVLGVDPRNGPVVVCPSAQEVAKVRRFAELYGSRVRLTEIKEGS